MFRPLREPTAEPCLIELDGERVEAPGGANLAAWLLTLEGTPFRVATVGGAPRAPYCMMGICFECLVEVDGVRDRQACLTTIREGMRIRRQIAALGADDG
jgi:predicted molibdopterin-dependent oxidoreductase YjgC